MLKVSKSGYYAWVKAGCPKPSDKDAVLLAHIRQVEREHARALTMALTREKPKLVLSIILIEEANIQQRNTEPYQEKTPFKLKPNLEGNWEFLYERTIGCVGTLKRWLNRAVREAKTDNSNTLTLNHLLLTAHSLDQCLKKADDALFGERRFVERPKNN